MDDLGRITEDDGIRTFESGGGVRDAGFLEGGQGQVYLHYFVKGNFV